jgi:hypothetical protein
MTTLFPVYNEKNTLVAYYQLEQEPQPKQEMDTLARQTHAIRCAMVNVNGMAYDTSERVNALAQLMFTVTRSPELIAQTPKLREQVALLVNELLDQVDAPTWTYGPKLRIELRQVVRMLDQLPERSDYQRDWIGDLLRGDLSLTS